MQHPELEIIHEPVLFNATMIVGFSGWMDGGDVSTGAIEYLSDTLHTQRFAEVRPGGFYIYNFPGSMEVSAMFCPHTEVVDGLVREYDEPRSTFHADEKNNVVLFSGREPNFRWDAYADILLGVARQLDVRRILFPGSVAGSVPHTRDIRFRCSVSHEEHRGFIDAHGMLPGNYEGPASFISYMLTRCAKEGIFMATLVAEIPGYVQGRNMKALHAVLDKIQEITQTPLDLASLQVMTREFEKKLDEVVAERPELAELIKDIEKSYDEENQASHMDELRDWFEKQDLRQQ